ncbi:MAG: hypothetical protein F4Y61_07890 [Rhodothermaceae bacterium]|nr:hypothetical protein [Rhodothermaceae bacterium]
MVAAARFGRAVGGGGVASGAVGAVAVGAPATALAHCGPLGGRLALGAVAGVVGPLVAGAAPGARHRDFEPAGAVGGGLVWHRIPPLGRCRSDAVTLAARPVRGTSL